MWWWFQPGGLDWPAFRTFVLTEDRIMKVDDDPTRRRTVRIPDRSIDSWPRLAGSITMRVLEGSQQQEIIRSQMAFDELRVDVDGEPMDRVFDLDVLREALQPSEVRPLNPDDEA